MEIEMLTILFHKHRFELMRIIHQSRRTKFITGHEPYVLLSFECVICGQRRTYKRSDIKNMLLNGKPYKNSMRKN